MNLKAKLFGLATLVGLLLALVMVFLLWHSYRVQESVRRFVPATEYLCNIAEARSSITRQMKETLDFLALGEGRDRQEYLHAGQRAEQALQRWRRAIEAQMTLGVPGEEDDLERLELATAHYRQWLQAVDEVYRLCLNAQPQLAKRKFIDDAEALLLNGVFVELDGALEDGQGEVQETYHELLLSLGMLPWIADKAALTLNRTQATIDYLVAVSGLSTGLNQQIAAVMNYLLYGTEVALKQLTLNEAKTRLALENLQRAHEQRLKLGSNDRDLGLVLSLDRHFQQSTALVGQLIDLKQQSQTLKVLAENTQALENIFETQLFPGLTKALEEGSTEIIDLTSTTGTRGILLMVLISLALLVFSLRWIRAMVAALGQIKTGMAIIGHGDLDHRINLNTGDELGGLAKAFDQMAAKLQKSKQEVDQVQASLEQRVRERTAQLETSNRELEAFSYSVSHDLRGPLTQVSGLTQLLMFQDEELEPEQKARYLQQICAATMKMSQTIDDLLQLSKISSALGAVDYVDLSALVAQIARELRDTDPGRRVRWTIASGLAAFGDRNLLRLALENLLGNAWKYTAQKPEAEIEFGQADKDGRLWFFVRDNGAGFDMRDVDRIFLPFQRLHAESEFAGSGIGLATVQRIIQRHGGEIRAEGVPGTGTTVYFSLNRVQQSPTFGGTEDCAAMQNT